MSLSRATQPSDAETPGEFLRAWIARHAPEASLRDLSTLCGFSSRSFLHDVMNDRRKLTLESMEKLSRGLKIRSQYRKHLKILQSLQEAKGEKKQKQLSALRLSRKKLRAITDTGSFNDLPEARGWDRVYAATGSLEKGATLREILSRSRLSIQRTLDVLQVLSNRGLVRIDEATETVYPRALHASFLSDPSSPEMKQYLIDALQSVLRSCERRFTRGTAGQTLYRNLVFSMDGDRYDEFRDRLRLLLEEFVDTTESAEGSRVARVFCAFEMLDDE